MEKLTRKDLPAEETYTWCGYDAEQLKVLEASLAADHSCPNRFKIAETDPGIVKKQKAENWAKEKAHRAKQVKETVASVNADFTNGGYVFPKGEPVKVYYRRMVLDEAAYLYQKLETLCNQELMKKEAPEPELVPEPVPELEEPPAPPTPVVKPKPKGKGK